MNQLNDVAIALAKRIEGALISDCLQAKPIRVAEDKSPHPEHQNIPNLYQTRRAILKALGEFVQLYSFEEHSSDYMIEDMRPEVLAHHKESIKERQATEFAYAVLNHKEIADKWEYAPENSDGYAAYRSVRSVYAVLKLGKIKREEEGR